jgi:apolipoprotein N-acyltransferase
MNPRIILAVLAAAIAASCWSRVTVTTGSTVTAIPVAAFLLAAIAALSLAAAVLMARSLVRFRSSPYPRTVS